MKTSQLLRATARRFARARLHYGHGTHNAKEEASWLFLHVLGSPLDLEKRIGTKDKKRILMLVQCRIRERVPLAYLLHEAWLGEHSFYVDRRAIVPRSFIAELLRDRLSPWLRREPKRALDLCTGSGCLAVLLALTFRKTRVDAADLSRDALNVAQRNLDRYRLEKRIKLIQSDLFESLPRRKYELIVCNPPYVTARSMRSLPAEYRHEPVPALAGGKNGLFFIEKIIRESRDRLKPRGLLACEIGGNRKALEQAFADLPFTWPETSEGPGCVFILEREQLPAAPNARRASASGRPARRGRARR